MKTIKYFFLFIWYYKYLIKIILSYDYFKLGEVIKTNSTGKQYKIYWKQKNNYWIK